MTDIEPSDPSAARPPGDAARAGARRSRLVWVLAFGIVLAVLVYVRWPGIAVVADAGLPAELHLRARAGADHARIYGLEVIGSGHVEGGARIELLLDGQLMKSLELSDEVAFTWDGDWYRPEALVRYVPLTARGGRILLKYRFRSL